MKTTIEIADELLAKAKRQARREGRTLREVVEQALRRHVTGGDAPRAFRLKRHPFKGKGRHPGIAEGDWSALRDAIYRLG